MTSLAPWPIGISKMILSIVLGPKQRSHVDKVAVTVTNGAAVIATIITGIMTTVMMTVVMMQLVEYVLVKVQASLL